jgi:dynein heavy chain
LHDNAEITTNQNETRSLLEDVLSMQPRASSGSGKTPAKFDLDEVQAKYQTDYNESMNTVLAQEVLRYNKLLIVMKQMLGDV